MITHVYILCVKLIFLTWKCKRKFSVDAHFEEMLLGLMPQCNCFFVAICANLLCQKKSCAHAHGVRLPRARYILHTCKYDGNSEAWSQRGLLKKFDWFLIGILTGKTRIPLKSASLTWEVILIFSGLNSAGEAVISGGNCLTFCFCKKNF